MDNRTAAPRSTPPSTPPTSSADDTAPESSATGSEPAAPPTTAASPARPTAADVDLLSFAQQFELTARDLYDAALAGAVKDTEHVNVFRAFRENHEEYANALSALLGVAAPQKRDDASFDSLEASFAADDLDGVIAAAYELESTAVVTHTDLVGRLEGVEGAKTLSGALLVESSHCTVLASVAGDGEDLAAMLDNSATSQAPAGGASEPSESEAAATEPASTDAAEDTEPETDGTESGDTDTDDSTTETTEA